MSKTEFNVAVSALICGLLSGLNLILMHLPTCLVWEEWRLVVMVLMFACGYSFGWFFYYCWNYFDKAEEFFKRYFFWMLFNVSALVTQIAIVILIIIFIFIPLKCPGISLMVVFACGFFQCGTTLYGIRSLELFFEVTHKTLENMFNGVKIGMTAIALIHVVVFVVWGANDYGSSAVFNFMSMFFAIETLISSLVLFFYYKKKTRHA